MKRNIREIEDNVYKEFIQDLLDNYPNLESKNQFEPADDLSFDETYKHKYLRLQNAIRLSRPPSGPIRENGIYNKKLKVENKLRKAINMIIREELNELGPKSMEYAASHLGKDVMHDIAKGILTTSDYDQIFDELVYEVGLDPKVAEEVVNLLARRSKDISLTEINNGKIYVLKSSQNRRLAYMFIDEKRIPIVLYNDNNYYVALEDDSIYKYFNIPLNHTSSMVDYYPSNEEKAELVKRLLPLLQRARLRAELKNGHISIPQDDIKAITKRLMERKKPKKEEPIDIDLDLDTPEGDEELNLDTEPTNDTPDMGMDTGDMGMGGSGDEKEIGNHLQAALEAAKRMPDSETKSKLIRQIGNTALFFLKTQIPTGDQA